MEVVVDWWSLFGGSRWLRFDCTSSQGFILHSACYVFTFFVCCKNAKSDHHEMQTNVCPTLIGQENSAQSKHKNKINGKKQTIYLLKSQSYKIKLVR
jgi:hypothetical protein